MRSETIGVSCYFSVGIGVADSGFNSRSGPVRFELKVERFRSYLVCRSKGRVFVRFHPVRDDVGSVFDIEFDSGVRRISSPRQKGRPLDIPQEHEEIGIRFSGELFPERVVKATLLFLIVLLTGCGVLLEILREIGRIGIIRSPILKITALENRILIARETNFVCGHIIFVSDFIRDNDLVMIEIEQDLIQLTAFQEIRNMNADLFRVISHALFRDGALLSEGIANCEVVGPCPVRFVRFRPVDLYLLKRSVLKKINATDPADRTVILANRELLDFKTVITAVYIAVTALYTIEVGVKKRGAGGQKQPGKQNNDCRKRTMKKLFSFHFCVRHTYSPFTVLLMAEEGAGVQFEAGFRFGFGVGFGFGSGRSLRPVF